MSNEVIDNRVGESVESKIDRETEDLLSLIIRKEASDSEIALFHELSAQRSSLMFRPRHSARNVASGGRR